MGQNIKEVVDSVLSLPVKSRAYLAEALLESLDFEEDFLISEEWMNEIKKRCHEIDKGEVELIAGEEALLDLQRKYS